MFVFVFVCVFVCVFVFVCVCVFVCVSVCAFDVMKLIKNFFFCWSKLETDLSMNHEINLVWP